MRHWSGGSAGKSGIVFQVMGLRGRSVGGGDARTGYRDS